MQVWVKAKLVNHNFLEAIHAKGFKTVAEFCREYHFTQTVIGEFVNLKATPRSKELCDRLEFSLCQPIDHLFPSDLVEMVSKNPKTRFYFHKDVEMLCLEQLSQKELCYEPKNNQEVYAGLESAITSLTEREEKLIRYRYGLNEKREGKSLDECGSMLGVTRERARQIEAKALRKLRHPTRVKIIKRGSDGNDNG